MENIVRKEIVERLGRNDGIINVQHGFVQGNSCLKTAVDINGRLVEMD